MSKKILNNRRQKFIHQMVFLVIVEIILLIVFGYIIYNNNPPDYDEIQYAVIKVEKVDYYHSFLNGDMLTLESNNQKYDFCKYPVIGTTEFSMSELHDCISVGDTIEIMYLKKQGTTFEIVNAISNDVCMRSVEFYNSYLKRQQITSIVVFVIIQLIYVIFSILYCICIGIEYKIFKRTGR